jgi:hypothetical protein
MLDIFSLVHQLCLLLKDLELKPLQEKRKHIRLTMFYKVVEGLVPAIASEGMQGFSLISSP